MDRFETRSLASFDGTPLAYHVAGEGPLILLANGLGGTRDAWRNQVRWFAARFRIATWDYRGTHGSGRPHDPAAFAMRDHVGDMTAVLDALGERAAIVVGWSVGVQLAFEAYRAHPERVRALVAINGSAGRPWRSAVGARAFPVAVGAALRALRAASGAASDVARRLAEWPDVLDWMRRLGLAGTTLDDEGFLALARAFATVDMETYLRTLAAASEHDASDVLPRVRVPTLVIAGERDVFTPRAAVDEMTRALPDAEVLFVARGTHYVALEYPELVNLRIEKFLREHAMLPRRGRR